MVRHLVALHLTDLISGMQVSIYLCSVQVQALHGVMPCCNFRDQYEMFKGNRFSGCYW